MFFRWLLADLPRDLRTAWRLLRTDLSTWLVLSAAFGALGALTVSSDAGPQLALPSALLALLLVTLVVLKFDAADRGTHVRLSQAGRCFARRGLPLLLSALFSVGLCILVGTAVRHVALAALSNRPHADALAVTAGILAYVATLVRFCFVPFLVLLEQPGESEASSGALRNPFPAVLRSLRLSVRLTRGAWLRLTPYVLVLSASPPTTGLTMPTLPAILALWQMAQLLAQAALFGHYRSRTALPEGVDA